MKMPKLCQILLPIYMIIFTFSWSTTNVNAAKVLGLFAHPSESHFAVMRSVITELAKREHNVTVFSSHRLSERIENVHEVIIEPEFPFWRELQKAASADGDLYQLSQFSSNAMQKMLANVGAKATDYFLLHARVRQLLHLPKHEFDYDLIIVDLFHTEALLAVGNAYATPTVGIVSSDFNNYMQHTLESMLPMACSPIDFGSYSKDSGFWARLSNIRNCMTRRKQFVKTNMEAQQQIITKHFAHFTDTARISIPELQSQLAVLLLNNHVPLATPRPLLPNIIAVGGLHIRPTRELPWHIRRFLDESRAGVIYMNLGNEQLCAEIPRNKLQILFNVLGKHRERILWTCHDVQQMDNLPKNIMIQHAVPQTDILAHPHVKIFLMNGDLLSLQEGIVRHVPIIGVPIFENEIHNMELAVRLGVAVSLDYASNFTEASLTWALQAIKYDAAYPLTIRQVSTEFRDRPLGALETCMYWIDYVLRHNGGAQIKTLGVGIPSNQLHLFDLFIFYFGIAVLIVGVLVGVMYAGLLLWKRQKLEKMYAKLN